MQNVVLSGLTKRYGDMTAVDNIDLEIKEKEILVLLGPSGCGKTTTLRCIAGLEYPDRGEIRIGDQVVFSDKKRIQVAPENRNLGMVFQSYAIWPHMTVFDNVAFSLQLRKESKEVIRDKVFHALQRVQIEDLAYRYATQISGGQQQRVALARSIANDPRVLLLDEPLSNLDAKLRERTRFELIELQRKIGITAIYVTHDQAEAMVISDRVAVMNQGKIIQLASAREIYDKPANRFVADFIGTTNFLQGTIVHLDDREARMESEIGTIISRQTHQSGFRLNQNIFVSIRPERVKILQDPSAATENTFEGTILKKAFLGEKNEYFIQIQGTGKEIHISTDPGFDFDLESKIRLHIPPASCSLVPP